jgi:hypothetical protein
MKHWWNETAGENRSIGRKTCPSATLSTTHPRWSEPESNPGLRDEMPETNRLSYGTAFQKSYCAPWGWQIFGRNLSWPVRSLSLLKNILCHSCRLPYYLSHYPEFFLEEKRETSILTRRSCWDVRYDGTLRLPQHDNNVSHKTVLWEAHLPIFNSLLHCVFLLFFSKPIH